MEYKVLKEHLMPEHAKWHETKEETKAEYPEQIWIYPDDVITDGHFEPDIVAGLWASGVIEPVDMQAEKARVKQTGRLNEPGAPNPEEEID